MEGEKTYKQCEICSVYHIGIYKKQYFDRHLKSNEHKLNIEFNKLNKQWEAESNEHKKEELFNQMNKIVEKQSKIPSLKKPAVIPYGIDYERDVEKSNKNITTSKEPEEEPKPSFVRLYTIMH